MPGRDTFTGHVFKLSPQFAGWGHPPSLPPQTLYVPDPPQKTTFAASSIPWTNG
ncbi:MAG: hypothetical protein H0T47_04750 [Planctomycetaceae bacterium]|nr:hypothetical protein [Planctomycetaceae bacterium]